MRNISRGICMSRCSFPSLLSRRLTSRVHGAFDRCTRDLGLIEGLGKTVREIVDELSLHNIVITTLEEQRNQ